MYMKVLTNPILLEKQADTVLYLEASQMLSSGYRKWQERLGCPQGTPAAIWSPFNGDWLLFLDNPASSEFRA